ncbi:hypothetical protein L7F22_050625 [Adiantum nelumboides]|nr:hypothetical protein [Adiantum nelumboides]
MDLMMFGALDELLLKTGLSPDRIDFLIVNVSMFYPAPSLSSHLVHHYKMRDDVKTFNISGIGCAAGMVAVDLAKDILRVHKNKYVVIVGTENITLNWYYGNDKSMLVPNCLFRCGSYALLMSNKSEDRHRSKFELVQSVRTTTGASDTSYNVIVTKEDDDGICCLEGVERREAAAWMECIDNYPVEISDSITPSHKFYGAVKLCEAEATATEEDIQKLEEEHRRRQQAHD